MYESELINNCIEVCYTEVFKPASSTPMRYDAMMHVIAYCEV